MAQRHLQDPAKTTPALQKLLDRQSKPPHAPRRDPRRMGAAIEGEANEVGVVDGLGGVLMHGEALVRGSRRPAALPLRRAPSGRPAP
eukprot:3952949-Pyramimonas_sp.AAC.1